MELTFNDEPIFVVGAPRSGTSMMQWSLRQHPRLWGGQESDYLAPLVDALREAHEYGSRRGNLHWLSGQGVDEDEFLRFIGYGLAALYSDRSGGLRWVEQTPYYTLRMNDMVSLFPKARFVYMLRDGRQVVHSLRNFVNPVEHEEACHIWKQYVEAALEFERSDDGGRMLTVRYEDVVDHTEDELRRVYHFVGETFEPKSVEFIRSKAPINSSFQGEASQEKLGPRWMAWTEEERRYFGEVAGSLLEALGFAQDDGWITEGL